MAPLYATTPEIQDGIRRAASALREKGALVHCITNYVTVESCANAVLAVGASPIMSDEPTDVEDIQNICGALVINIGTLNQQTIQGMMAAGDAAARAKHPIVLDPVGAGASQLRTHVSSTLLNTLPVTLIRSNMSEAKALSGASAKTKGVDVNPEDAVTPENLERSARFARDLARNAGCVVAITGAIDLISDGQRVFAVGNGSPMQGRITGAGCMLSAFSGGYLAANPEDALFAALAAVVHAGVAGQRAQARMEGNPQDGTGSFRTYLMDALSTLTPDQLAAEARVEQVL